MQGLQDIAKDMGLTKQAVAIALKKALSKVWYNIGSLYKDEPPFERMLIVAEFCNITQADDFAPFFYGFPTEIRKEVLDDVASRKNLGNLDQFLGRDYKKRLGMKQVEW